MSKLSASQRSAAAKRGWVTRRERTRLKEIQRTVRELTFEERCFVYPKVLRTFKRALKLQKLHAKILDEQTKLGRLMGELPPPETLRDKIHRKLASIEDEKARDRKIRQISETAGISAREIYTLFYSPDAA